MNAERPVVNISMPSDLRRLRVDKTAHYRLIRDIDMEGKVLNPAGNEASPFTGILDGNGFAIKNLVMPFSSSDGNLGIVSRNQGIIRNLRLENVTVTADEKTRHLGCFAGINEGQITGCHISGTLIGKAAAGAIAGVSSGVIENCFVSAALTHAAALVGKLTDGEILGCHTSQSPLVGEMTGGRLTECVMDSTALPAVQSLCGGQPEYLYRDVHCDNELTPGQYLLRAMAVEHMHRMATIPWSPDVELNWKTVYGHDTVTQHYEVGKTYYGMPYTNKYGSLERFEACFNVDGTLKEFIKAMPTGYDGFDLYVGNDCSGAVYWAWSRIGSSFSFRFTGDAMPLTEGGTLPVGDYAFEPGMETDQIRDRNGEQIMAESYAKLYLGDAILQRTKAGGGHIRMVSKTPVIYRHRDGSIDLDNSYLFCHEQGGNTGFNMKVGGWNSTWLTDYRYTFRDLYGAHYIPITIRELQEGVRPKATLKEEITAMNSGRVSSNWRIISTTAKVLDGEREIWRDCAFTAVHPYDAETQDTMARSTVREVDLAVHGKNWRDDILRPGKQYVYQVEVLLGNGEVLTTNPISI